LLNKIKKGSGLTPVLLEYNTNFQNSKNLNEPDA
jgi:hypothetical protein